MRIAGRLLGVAGAAVLLGGCQSFPLTSWMFRDARPAQGPAQLQALDTAVALQEGRTYLQQRRISAAIASFQMARLDPSQAAEANNGLAIAYAALGRTDLAERFFRAAASAEPGNSKYAANLLRLQQNVQLAARQVAPIPAAISAPRELAAARVVTSPSRTSGPIERISQAEVFVHSSSAPAAPPSMAVVQYRALAAQPLPAIVPGPEAPQLEGAAQPTTLAHHSPAMILFPE